MVEMFQCEKKKEKLKESTKWISEYVTEIGSRACSTDFVLVKEENVSKMMTNLKINDLF